MHELVYSKILASNDATFSKELFEKLNTCRVTTESKSNVLSINVPSIADNDPITFSSDVIISSEEHLRNVYSNKNVLGE